MLPPYERAARLAVTSKSGSASSNLALSVHFHEFLGCGVEGRNS